jgi:UDP-N-acetylglucosamine/UDP-N-acetylgalactosamine diphosphorylase
MLDRQPIFLGGQGGIVGPVRLGYGTVTVAGAIIRQDCPEGGKILGSQSIPLEKELLPGYHADIRRKVVNNIIYMANLMALRQWYGHIRHRFFEMQEFGSLLQETAVELIGTALAERLKRLRDLADTIRGSLAAGHSPGGAGPLHRQFVARWQALEAVLLDKRPEEAAGITDRDAFIRGIWAMMEKQEGDYLRCIGAIDARTKAQGTAWLQAIIDGVLVHAIEAVPLLRID